MNEKERLLKILRGENVDRPPVICPGGMMNAAVTELLGEINDNHNTDLDAMVSTAIKVREIIGFENYGVPFCMTCESEPFGVVISEGDKNNEPRILKYNDSDLEEIMRNFNPKLSINSKGQTVIKAIERLRNDEIPVIGNITGPISTATSIVDPLKLFKMLRKEPDEAYRFIEYVNNYLIEYARKMVGVGADLIAISDPTATGEILGKKNFDKFAMPMYVKFLEAMKEIDTPVIIHICGDAKTIIDSLNSLDVEALSFDSIVNMRFAKSKLSTRLMGNVSTLLIQNGPIDKIISITKNAMDSKVDIVSPACGLGMSTPIGNLRAMTDYVKGSI
ncbi:uroporphyrinogen decarboxylase family protein [Tissierella sp. MB52-C2]|uniref:uroporphyrinogen decarboxylase family protein n=1 Tax=Tissierella sp. MB52-C2 TaxID=3070999 RepID=UPI00280BFAE2|nr:uroporphyrinogen decarboxylase family protein [Tissierella sp. MB52-C2]WMM24428.1 uroporphyrinogen decarboxylase family protein [Tissierella sp. MB52-C2]